MQMHMDTVATPVNAPVATEEGPVSQNIENNPMQSRRGAAGTRTSDLTRRANQW